MSQDFARNQGMENPTMRVRCDGEQTRRKIIDAASRVFSENGFHDATHDAICGLAKANRAAINHHFGDKKSLYRVVWQHLLDGADRDNPVLGSTPDGATPAERFKTHIRALLHRHFGPGSSRQLGRLRNLERVNPTGLVDDILAAHHTANRKEMLRVLRELLGDEASRKTIRFYETSVLALCHGEWFDSDRQRKQLATTGAINMLAASIARLVLAGIDNRIHAKVADKAS